ncbi:MAG: hypothetical protein WCR52_04395 [Bacteroidota bacterium]
MRIFFFLMMLVMFTGVFLTGIVYVIAKAISQISFNPESTSWKRMIERLRAQVKKQTDGKLVPWDTEMLSLLSFNRSIVKKPGFFDNTAEGVYTTIFHEPILAYALQKSGNTGVTVAATSDREFIYRNKGKETEIWLNGQPYALYIDGNLLAAGKTSRILARLEQADDELALPVLIGDKEAASIANPSRISSPNPRALTILRTLTAEEENALLALAVLKMTQV